MKYIFKVEKWETYEIEADSLDEAIEELVDNTSLEPTDSGYPEDAFNDSTLLKEIKLKEQSMNTTL